VRLPIHIVDAFADRPFAGNPAAVCPLPDWLPTATMQAIAAEMNLSETVFFAPSSVGCGYDVRWFTPTREVDMIGHATLAAGHLVFERIEPDADEALFRSRGATLAVRRDSEGLTLDMPALPPRPMEPVPALAAALGAAPAETHAAKHYLCVFARREEIADLRPDMAALARLDLPAVIVTAPGGTQADFVSRFFAPANGVPEDPVSGVAHLCLAPYWSRRLGRADLVGRQLSKRGGTVRCRDRGTRVILGGCATTFLSGEIVV
jgi:PhzF family phenazine biosynthesis protein